MSTPTGAGPDPAPDDEPGTRSGRRAAGSLRRRAVAGLTVGFVIGFVIALPAALLAVAHPVGETLKPYLLPGLVLVAPLQEQSATWPGVVGVTVGSVANGLVFSVLGTATALASAVARRRRR